VDLGTIAGIVVTLMAVWAGLLALFSAMRPKGVPVREVVGVIADVLRLLRSGGWRRIDVICASVGPR